MAKSNTHDIAIIGGGMVGASLAVALAREGLDVGIVERSPFSSQLEPAFDGRVSAIALGSKNILENIGVWEAMREQAQPIFDIRVSDGATPFFLHYCHHEISDEPFGYIVENRYIRHALHRALLAKKNITAYEGETLSGFSAEEAGCEVTLGNRTLRCRLLIGADGKQSKVRKLAGIKAVEWGYRQTAIVCTIAHERAHDGLAQERFLPAGPFAVLPMTGNRSSLVWVEPEDRVGVYLQLPESEFIQEIEERVGSYLGKIALEGDRFSYPLSLMHAREYVGKRLALVGDAAHAIHPIAGQGVNLGFRDVAALAELIAERHHGNLDIGEEATLAHYQRWRRFDNTTMTTVTDGLNRLFSNNLLPIKLARDLGLWAVSKLPMAKRFFMSHAMGLEGNIPKLMKKVS